MNLAPGVVIAQRYELIRQLGEGGMGVVWSALHTLTQKPVALKFLKAPASEEMILRFIREARAVGGVRHPNIIAAGFRPAFPLLRPSPSTLRRGRAARSARPGSRTPSSPMCAQQHHKR